MTAAALRPRTSWFLAITILAVERSPSAICHPVVHRVLHNSQGFGDALAIVARLGLIDSGTTALVGLG